MKVLAFALGMLAFGDIGPAHAACLLPGGLGGNDTAYHYAVAQINGLIYADMATDKLSPPTGKTSAGLVGLSERLIKAELAARDFECAVLEVGRQEQFAISSSDELSVKASEMAQQTASLAAGIYGKLAEKSRMFGSLLQEATGQSMSEAEFAGRFAKISADYQDLLSTVMTLPAAVAFVLVDSKPDSAGHLSRLRITAKERADLVRFIDTAFGKRARSSTDHDLPYIDAAIIMLRQWLTKPGYTVRP